VAIVVVLTRGMHFQLQFHSQLILVNIREDASYGGSKATRIPFPKVHINGEINTKMENKLKTNVWWALCGD
jgi:hypothetical protein